MPARRAAPDYSTSPLLVFYEITRACDLVCAHCRACAQPRAHPMELSCTDARRLIDQIAAFPQPPILVLTGGDPLKRPDVHDLIAHAAARGLDVAMTPSATPLATAPAIARMKQAGLRRFAVSLDGADAPTHDGFRGVAGSFDRTLQMLADARAVGLSIQVNTTLTLGNAHQLEAMADLLEGRGIVLWSVFFLVPVGRGLRQQRLSARQIEDVFQRLWQQSQRRPFAIKTTEAPHYRRFVLQRLAGGCGGGPAPPSLPIAAGTNDGRGVMFVSHTGHIYPSGFLPVTCGHFPRDNVVEVYQRSPTFLALRDSARLKGKCGVCEFNDICGGSRARAYAIHRDILAPEPDCAYIPAALAQQLTDNWQLTAGN